MKASAWSDQPLNLHGFLLPSFFPSRAMALNESSVEQSEQVSDSPALPLQVSALAIQPQDANEPRLEMGRRIKIMFSEAGYRNLRDVHCDYQNGCVVLTGSVSSFYFKQIAQVITARMDGVKTIKNLIQVNDQPAE